MTREEALVGHRRLWNEIADMIESGIKFHNHCDYKDEALKRIGEKQVLENECYLCEYSTECKKPCILGRSCLVAWSGLWCMDKTSEYRLFWLAIHGHDYPAAAQIARKIANLPERVSE